MFQVIKSKTLSAINDIKAIEEGYALVRKSVQSDVDRNLTDIGNSLYALDSFKHGTTVERGVALCALAARSQGYHFVSNTATGFLPALRCKRMGMVRGLADSAKWSVKIYGSILGAKAIRKLYDEGKSVN